MKHLPATELLLRLMANEPDEFKHGGKYEEMNRAMRALAINVEGVHGPYNDEEVELRGLPARDRTALINGYRTHVINTQLTGRLLKAASGETKRERDASRVATHTRPFMDTPQTWPTGDEWAITTTAAGNINQVLVSDNTSEVRWAKIGEIK